MDKLTFISEITRAIAWPSAIVILILILRKPLGGLIPLLQRLKYKDFELEFGRKLQEAKAEADIGLQAGSSLQELPDKIFDLAEVSPRAAVLEAWRRLEAQLVDLPKSHLNTERRPSKILPMQAISTLAKKGVIDKGTEKLLRDLRALRNEANYAPDSALSMDQALEYATLAEQVAQQLKSAP